MSLYSKNCQRAQQDHHGQCGAQCGKRNVVQRIVNLLPDHRNSSYFGVSEAESPTFAQSGRVRDKGDNTRDACLAHLALFSSGCRNMLILIGNVTPLQRHTSSIGPDRLFTSVWDLVKCEEWTLLCPRPNKNRAMLPGDPVNYAESVYMCAALRLLPISRIDSSHHMWLICVAFTRRYMWIVLKPGPSVPRHRKSVAWANASHDHTHCVRQRSLHCPRIHGA